MATFNAFDLLGGEEGAELSVEELAKQSAPAKEAAPKADDAKQGTRAPPAAGRGGRDAAGRGNDRSLSGRGRGGPRAADDATTFDAEVAPTVRGRSGRGAGRGRGGGRGAGGPRGKREYDRHDGTGRGHETEKRHGQGAHNWGAETEEAAEDAGKVQAEEAKPEEAAPAEGAAEGEAPAPEPEPEEVQMTLEEYEALLAEKRAGLNAQREAAFKPDESQFKGFKQFAKEEEDAADIGLGLSKNAKVIGTNKAGREKERKEKELLTPNFRVQSSEEARGSRGGGRGGRGGRAGGRREGGRGQGRSNGSGREGCRVEGGRGQGRGGRGPNFDDSAFPVLSAQA